jgi:hypothetical protein
VLLVVTVFIGATYYSKLKAKVSVVKDDNYEKGDGEKEGENESADGRRGESKDKGSLQRERIEEHGSNKSEILNTNKTSDREDEVKRPCTAGIVGYINSIKERIVPFFPKIKIIIATFQIVSSSASSFSITYPASLTAFFSFTKILNFALVQILPLSCMYQADYITSMMITTLLPILGTALLFIAFAVELAYKYRRLKAKNEKVLRKQTVMLIDDLRFRYFSLFLTMTYFVLPSTTTSIFQMFLCENVDPEDVNSSFADTYMVADYSIKCSSQRYTFGMIWAIIMIFVYPIGIPAYYFWLLYRYKESIKDRPDEEDANGNGVDPETKMLEFLYSSYHPRYWYFEVVETMRRLMLTAIIAVIATGSSSQIVCAMMLAFVFLKVYVYCSPYIDEENGILAEVAQYQIFFTYFGALITTENLLGAALNNLVGIFLILLNMSVALLSFYFELNADVQEDGQIFSIFLYCLKRTHPLYIFSQKESKEP